MLTLSSDVRRGLEGVVVDRTAISRPEIDSLTYRGYPVQELATYCGFEEVAYLIWYGELPDQAQLDAFQRNKRTYREISDYLIETIQRFPPNTLPVDALRTAVSALGMEDPKAGDNSPLANQEKALKLMARVPTLLATDYRRRQGLERIPPDPGLGFAANFFNMCFGKIPAPEVLRCFEISLILYAEHGFNPSTFAARIAASTLSDIYSAITGAIGTLKGSLHGGSNAAVMRMLLEIDKSEQAQTWLDKALAEKRKIMGFGHRVYKRGDPRVPIMYDALLTIVANEDDRKWLEIESIIANTMVGGRRLYPNVDFVTGPAYYLMGFDIDMFSPLFMLGRMVGWTAHFMEQLSANKFIRPLSVYDGPPQRSVPRKERRAV